MATNFNASIKLSVALVTRNRPESLARTLRSLCKQNVQPYEVIVSDDSDMENMINANIELARNYSCKYIKGPGKGLYANRNLVAKSCTGTHIRTMDDDHEFPENHVMNCLKAIEEEPDTIWTIGEFYPTDKVKTLPAPIPGQLHPRGYSYSPKNIKKYFGISCGASIYPKSVIDRNILNAEAYRFGILYLEYGARLYKKGYTIKPLAITYVIHHYDENNRSESKSDIIKGAQIFSMLMFSFNHMKNFKNCFFTTTEIIKNLLLHKYSFRIIRDAYLKYKKQSAMINSIA
jgi:glycosyltransferase involved in cell wall biosynthesis